jgi:hypothetical protein
VLHLFRFKWSAPVINAHNFHRVNYETSKILGETYGVRKPDEISHTLRKAFRKTDLVARDWADFWILVPFTPAKEKLVGKIA